MKLLLRAICAVLLCLPLGVLGQAFTQRTNGTFTPTDPFLNVSKGLYIPRVCDTIGAVKGLDTLGAVVYDKCNHKIWFRDTNNAGSHYWRDIANNITAENGLYKVGDKIVLGTGLKDHIDSTAIIIYNARKYIGATSNGIRLSNINLDSVGLWAANSTVTGITSFQQSALNATAYYDEAAGDTIFLQYGAPISTLWWSKYDSVGTRYKQPGGVGMFFPYTGFGASNRIFLPRDSVNIYTGANGGQSSEFFGDWAVGDSYGYNAYIFSGNYPSYPLAVSNMQPDLQRVLSRGRKRKLTGNGVAGYFWNYKDYQGSINGSTIQDSAYHSKLYGYYAAGEREGDFTVDTATASKDYILGISKNDSVFAYYAAPMYTRSNSVYNGYGYVSIGANDFNYFAGRLRVGSFLPTRDNGALRYNLEAPGSTRTDTIYNLYQKFDSTGKMLFTPKSGTSVNGGVIQAISFIDSTQTNSNNFLGGILMMKAFTDMKTDIQCGSKANFDSRSQINLSTANRSTLFGQGAICPNMNFYGYSEINLSGANATATQRPGVLPFTIFYGRNQLRATGAASGHASGLDLVTFGGLFDLGTGVDSVRNITQFEDFGVPTNSIGRINTYSSFKSDVVNLSNADSTFGFLQISSDVRNKFLGTMELPSLSLINDTTNYKVVIANSSGKLFKGNWNNAGVNISNTALHANADYLHNWGNRNLFIDSVKTYAILSYGNVSALPRTSSISINPSGISNAVNMFLAMRKSDNSSDSVASNISLRYPSDISLSSVNATLGKQSEIIVGPGNVSLAASDSITIAGLSNSGQAVDSIYGAGQWSHVLKQNSILKIPASAIRSITSHVIFTPTTGGTVNLNNRQYNIINPAGAIATLTVNLPSSPANNDRVEIKFTQAVTTVTYGNGTVVDGIVGPTAGQIVILVYDSGTTSWY